MFQEYFKVSGCFNFKILTHSLCSYTSMQGLVYLFVLDVNVDVFVTLNVGGGVVGWWRWGCGHVVVVVVKPIFRSNTT